jgi:hypothetical protein
LTKPDFPAMTEQNRRDFPHMTPQDILDHLHGAPAQRLSDLPEGQGLYALYDHSGQPRYIGSTTMGLRRRIHDYHAGGDGNSHKFSTVYNAGRMFHARKDPFTDAEDGKIAKKLRRLFARSQCSAVGLELPGISKQELFDLETKVYRLAPPETISWNHARSLPTIDPGRSLDQFIDNLAWPTPWLDAIDRQAARWQDKLKSQSLS